MGIDLLSGGAFYCDPVGWVTDDRSRSPTRTFVANRRGKVGTVKAFCLRMMEFGTGR
jgi:hypothetical protein